MGRKHIFDLLAAGEPVPAADQVSLKLPVLNSAIASYAVAKYVPGAQQQAILTLTALPITVANTTGASFGSVKLFDFPAGRIRIEGGTVNFTSVNWAGTTIVATGSGDYSLGTTATADATLNSTDVDLVASTALLDPFVAGVGTGVGGVFVKDTEFDGSSTAKDVYLNMIIDDADVEDAGSAIVLVTGIIHFHCAYGGDY